METFFISDIHLHTERPEITNAFLRFLREKAKNADALYILGDLFEAWIGNDNSIHLNTKISKAINTLVNSGIPCYFLDGNRDYLLNKNFARQSGITMLPEEKVLDLYGRNILVMHGDTLCTDDTSYQAFRKKIHTPWIQKLFLILPLFLRNSIAIKVRAASQAINKRKSAAIMDVNPEAVVQIMEKYDVQWLIHGHTHRPNIHNLTANGLSAYRIVLGAWYGEGSMVKVTPENVELITFPF